MAFLSTEERFGPDLTKYRHGEPDPCTYPARDDGLVIPGGSQISGTFGYHRPVQHEAPSPFAAAAETSAAMAATLKAMTANSLSHIRESNAPDSWSYSPTVDGQFHRVYTMKEINAERKRSSHQRQPPTTAPEVHLALGPGSYEVDQDPHQVAIATPFTFAREKRHGILDNTAALGRVGCSPGPTMYRVDSSTAVASASALATTALQSKNASTFLTRVRSDGQLQCRNAAKYSKEMAQSYRELNTSVRKLENRLASPELRERTFRRFNTDNTAVEAYRRGPGSYDSPMGSANNPPSQKNSKDDDKIVNRRASWCQLSPLPTSKQKQSSSFGRVANRDLLSSMIAAGHASKHTIGPGVYDAYPASCSIPTHNIGYKPLMQQSGKTRRTRTGSADCTDEETRQLSKREMWKVMRHGPALPS